jgi:hypothetical protein
MSSLVVIYLSYYYRFVLLPHYELVHPWASVAYVQTISSDVARASPQLVSPLVSHVCHHSGPDLFLCGHKSIVAYVSQLRLVVWACRLLVGQHSAPYNMAGRIAVL